jgi:hypothetical protein
MWREHTQAQAQAQARAQAHAQARARGAWERQQQELQRAARKQLALKKLELLNRRMATLTNQNTVGGVFECRVAADVNLLFCAVLYFEANVPCAATNKSYAYFCCVA